MNCLRNLLALSLVPLASPAQTDRELSTPTATYWSTDRTPAQVGAMVQQGWRITDLGFLGAPGCSLRCSLDASAGVPTSVSGRARLQIGIPAVTSLIGGALHAQWLVVDAAANQAGVTTSNGGTLSIGGYR